MSEPFANYQFGVYLAGLSGLLPELPMTCEAMESVAREKLSPGAYGYVAGGAGSEDTMRENLAAFRRRRIVPRMLRDVGERDLSIELFGKRFESPILLAPVGVQGIVHPEGELATARAAAATGVPFVLSTASSRTLEEVASVAEGVQRWFQLYWPRDKDVAASLLARAEKAGYSALVVTLDTWLLAWRPRDLEQAYLPFLRGEGIANYLSDPAFRAGLAAPPEEDLQGAVMKFVGLFSDPTVTWTDLAFLREHWSGPIILKGILRPDDARRAVEAGMDGIIVSNHGGRQVDGAIASLDALPAVAGAVPSGFPVLLDSGVRTAADIFKAIALGARAVLIGRPFMWGLAVAGQSGVEHVLRCLLAELDLTLALSGYSALAEVGTDAIRTE